MRKSAIFLLGFLFTLSNQVFGQQKYGEMKLSALEELKTVVRHEDKSVLVVISEVPDLEFESTRKIFEINKIADNEWRVLVEPGRQIITVRSLGYLPVKTGVVNLKVRRAFKVTLTQVKPVPGILLIETSPDSAVLRINGAPISEKTPYRNEETLPGIYYIQISKQGFKSVEKTLVVEPNQITNWDVTLVKTAVRVLIDVQNEVSEVGIVVDGRAIGFAPQDVYLDPGSHLIRWHKPGYEDVEKLIEIELGMKGLQLFEILNKKSKPIVSRWWFLMGSAAAISGAAYLVGSGIEKPVATLPEPPDFPQN